MGKMNDTKMKILITDDHSVMRKGLQVVLQRFSHDIHIDEATLGAEALKRLKQNNYDLVILDISLPDINGLDILQQLKDMGVDTRCVIYSLHPEEVFAVRSFKLGAVGYIHKGAGIDEISKALEKVINGGKYVSNDFAEKLAFHTDQNNLPHEKLTEREFQVFLMMASGKSVSEIAKKTFISIKTVSTYRSRILQKMALKSSAELTMYAIKNNLIVV